MSIDLQKIRHWKVLTYLTVEILIEDKFYAKTPELGDIRTFPPSSLRYLPSANVAVIPDVPVEAISFQVDPS